MRTASHKALAKTLLVAASVAVFATGAQTPRESMADKVRKAFSLVGRWEITRCDVVYASSTHNAMPEASAAQLNILVQSELGSSAYFDVAPGGAISGVGQAQYVYRVAAGTTNPMSIGNVNVPVGAVCSFAQGEKGVRDFSITGQADLVARTIKLNAFQPTGADLKMVTMPGRSAFTTPAWPAMTNVEAKVIVAGSSLLLRASGLVGNIKCTLEAVKYVDLAPLFTAIEELIGGVGVAGAPGAAGTPGGAGAPGAAGAGGAPGAPAGGGGVGEQPGRGGGSVSLLAGTVSVPLGGSATVSFRAPLAGGSYAVALTPKSGPGAAVTFSEKTPAGFRVNAAKQGLSAGSVDVDWVVAPYSN